MACELSRAILVNFRNTVGRKVMYAECVMCSTDILQMKQNVMVVHLNDDLFVTKAFGKGSRYLVKNTASKELGNTSSSLSDGFRYIVRHMISEGSESTFSSRSDSFRYVVRYLKGSGMHS
jgi:hypothetical protein